MGDGAIPQSAALYQRRRSIGIIASVGLVIVALLLAAQGEDGSHTWAVDTSPHQVGVSDLDALATELGHPLYWAGQRGRARVEATREPDGSVYLRYLPPGIGVGDPSQRFLTVGTYRVSDAVAALRRAAGKAGVGLRREAGGRVVLADPSAQGSVYFAYPGSDLQVEVYDPTPGRSLRLIRSGSIRPVG